MRIFTAGDNVFHCEPVGVEDSETARQCSDYLNYIFIKRTQDLHHYILHLKMH